MLRACRLSCEHPNPLGIERWRNQRRWKLGVPYRPIFSWFVQLSNHLKSESVTSPIRISFYKKNILQQIAHLASTYIEIDISAASALTTFSFNTENNLVVMIFHTKIWIDECPFLFDGAQVFTWCCNINRLQTARETTKLTSQWTMKTNNFIFSNIQNLHFKWTTWTAYLTRATVRFFFCPVNLRK